MRTAFEDRAANSSIDSTIYNLIHCTITEIEAFNFFRQNERYWAVFSQQSRPCGSICYTKSIRKRKIL